MFAATASGGLPGVGLRDDVLGHGQAAGLLMLALVAADAIDEGSERAQQARA